MNFKKAARVMAILVLIIYYLSWMLIISVETVVVKWSLNIRLRYTATSSAVCHYLVVAKES